MLINSSRESGIIRGPIFTAGLINRGSRTLPSVTISMLNPERG